MKFKKIGNIVVAAGAGAAIGSAAAMVLAKTPMINNYMGGLVGTAVGLYASYLVGQKFGSGIAGAAGFALATGALTQVLQNQSITA